MLDGTYFFECNCGSKEHTLRFVLDKDEHEIYVSIFLNQWRPFYKRIWVALKYVFGYKSKYGHWDNWTLCEDDAGKLREMVDDFLSNQPKIPGPSAVI